MKNFLILILFLLFAVDLAQAGYTGPNPKFTSVQGGNLKLSGNILSSENSNGDINLTPNGSGSAKVATQSPGDNSTKIASTAYVDAGLALRQLLLGNSAGLASALSDETGTGFAVFSASPALTGSPTAPTQTAGDNSTKLATTAYVANQIALISGGGITSLNGLTVAVQLFATGTSGTAPAFSSSIATHTLNIPMASAGGTVTAGLVSNAEYATLTAKQDALVNSAGLASALSDETGTGVAVFSVSPALTGNPTVPTQTAGNNSTRVASTAFVTSAIAGITGTVSASLAAADAANTYFTDVNGNVFAYWTDLPFYNVAEGTSTYIDVNISTTQYDILGCAFSRDGRFLIGAMESSLKARAWTVQGDRFFKLADPTTTPTGAYNGADISYDSTYFAWATTNTPFYSIQKRNTVTNILTDLGTALGTNPGATSSPAIKFFPSDYRACVGSGTSPFIACYYPSATDAWTKIANGNFDVAPTGAVNGIDISEDGTVMCLAHTTSPFMSCYAISGSGSSTAFTKMTNPGTLPAGAGQAVSINHAKSQIALAHTGVTGNLKFVSVFSLSGSTITKLSDPAVVPAGSNGNSCFGVDYSSKDEYLALSCGTGIGTGPNQKQWLYTVSGTTFTSQGLPVADTFYNSTSACFSPDNQFLLVGANDTAEYVLFKSFKQPALKVQKTSNP